MNHWKTANSITKNGCRFLDWMFLINYSYLKYRSQWQILQNTKFQQKMFIALIRFIAKDYTVTKKMKKQNKKETMWALKNYISS